MLYARKGEVVTCENGHRIGVFNQDVFGDQPASAAQIDWMIEPAPERGSPVTPCQCGARYAGGTPGMVVHIGDGWRAVGASAREFVKAMGKRISEVPPN